jgi:hypothetical protein
MRQPFTPQIFTLGFVLALSSVAVAGGTHSRFASVSLYTSNTDYPANSGGGVYFHEEDTSGVFNNGEEVFYSVNQSYTGLDSNGLEQTMTFEGDGFAQGNYSIAKVGFWGTLFNPFYNPDNPWRFRSDTFEFDPNGVPDLINGEAKAGWVDTLQFGGTATNYKASYVFYIDGSNTDRAFSFLQTTIAGVSEQFFFDWDGYDAAVIRTQAVPITNNLQVADITLGAWVQPITKYMTEGQTYEMFSDFTSTLTLAGLEVFDENNNLVTNVTITGASGTTYQAVPEPGTMAALGLGLAALLKRSRRTK